MLVPRPAGCNGVGAIATLDTDANIAVLGDQICSFGLGSLASAVTVGRTRFRASLSSELLEGVCV